jgi:hypothetical protein
MLRQLPPLAPIRFGGLEPEVQSGDALLLGREFALQAQALGMEALQLGLCMRGIRGKPAAFIAFQLEQLAQGDDLLVGSPELLLEMRHMDPAREDLLLEQICAHL